MLIRIHVISGCSLPTEQSLRNTLYSELEKTFNENQVYSSLNFDEIEMAFRMNASGDLGERVKHWQNNFNLDYFGLVIDRYITLRAQVRHRASYYLIKPSAGIVLNDWKYCCELAYQQYLSGSYTISLWPSECYEEIVNSGFCSQDLFTTFITEAKSLMLNSLFDQKTDAMINHQHGLLKQIKDAIGNLQRVEYMDDEIFRIAKRLALRAVFAKANNLNYKNLFIQEE